MTTPQIVSCAEACAETELGTMIWPAPLNVACRQRSAPTVIRLALSIVVPAAMVNLRPAIVIEPSALFVAATYADTVPQIVTLVDTFAVTELGTMT